MSVSQYDEDNNEITPFKWYRPEEIDEYLVIVKLPEDWDEVHNYIINDNEIDGIPNRKIDCTNDRVFSLRSSIYLMSHEEAEILKTHSKVENVLLNPEKYPQPDSLFSFKFNQNVAFNKPLIPGAPYVESIKHTNSIRSNWSHTFVNGGQRSLPYKGVGISTDTADDDILYSLTGKNVDAVIIDSGVSVLHPDFIADDGTYRVRDVILDGPYKVDPAAFSGYTQTVTIDGVNIGTRAQESRARSWWSTPSIRSTEFQSLGTLSITSLYTRIHAHSKNGTNSINNSHGTSCASQIGGKWHGLAFECNLWNIRIALGSAGGIIGSSTALDACTIFHNAKKIAQDVADPTLINNSYGGNAQTGNLTGVTYTTGFRGTTLTYTGNNSTSTIPANSGAARCTKRFRYKLPTITVLGQYSGSGMYLDENSTRQATSSSAENAIAAGCIVVASAGNNNQKLSDKNDIDYNNWYGSPTTYINRVYGIQKGFSGDDEPLKGSIRVGALDCSVEPTDEKQGATKYSIRKVSYSSNGPMINIWAPAEYTMAAAYASGENYAREDDSNYYDKWFNGTSSAGPNACSVIALELQTNRKANQQDIHNFFATGSGAITMGSTEFSDPYPDVNDASYFSNDADTSFDSPPLMECYNVRGCGNLRGAPRRVLNNPYASNLIPTFAGVTGGENIETSELLFNLDANNYTSGTTWNDSSGEGNNGTLINSPTYQSQHGGCFSFNGSNEWVDMTEKSDFGLGTDPFSIEMWFTRDSGNQSQYASLISLTKNITEGHNDASTFQIDCHQDNSFKIALSPRDNNNNSLKHVFNTVIPAETWTHMVIVREGTGANQVKCYVNGVVESSTYQMNYTMTNSDPRFQVATNRARNHYHKGKISQVRVYKNKGLTASEVKKNFDEMKGRYLEEPLVLSGISYSLT